VRQAVTRYSSPTARFVPLQWRAIATEVPTQLTVHQGGTSRPDHMCAHDRAGACKKKKKVGGAPPVRGQVNAASKTAVQDQIGSCKRLLEAASDLDAARAAVLQLETEAHKLLEALQGTA